jgi:hypothetical protein
MTPVLLGRIQTRLFVTLVVGLPWTLLVTPLLALGIDGGLGDAYRFSLSVLLVTVVAGCVAWEPLWHGLMRLRWEEDWPALFHLLQAVPEGVTTFLLLQVVAPLPGGVPVVAYVALFSSTWILTWLFANGPMKILSIRWRFDGGRLV